MNAKDDIWDRIGASSPLNRTAASVVSESQDTPPDREYSIRHWKAPPIAKAITHEMRQSPSFEDLTGRTFGMFTVCGLFDQGRKAPKQLWICRCRCGDYEPRTAKAIRNPHNEDDRCEDCRRLAYLRQRELDKGSGSVRPVTIEEAVERIRAASHKNKE